MVCDSLPIWRRVTAGVGREMADKGVFAVVGRAGSLFMKSSIQFCNRMAERRLSGSILNSIIRGMMLANRYWATRRSLVRNENRMCFRCSPEFLKASNRMFTQ